MQSCERKTGGGLQGTVALSLLLCCACGPHGHTPRTPPASKGASMPFSPYGTRTPTMGFFGASNGSLTRDGQPVLVMSNGLDISPQPLALQPSDLSQRPVWFSSDIDYLGRLVLADLDKDGALDAIVPTLIDHALMFAGGVLKVYRGDARGLVPTPAQSVASGGSLTCAAGDADGDGDTDVAIAMMGSAGQLGQLPPPSAGPIKIFLNHGGVLQAEPGWSAQQQPASYVGGLSFADANQDGLMDLIASGDRLMIYYGGATPDGSRLELEPGWTSRDQWQVGYDLAWSKAGKAAPFQVVVSATCVSGFLSCGSTPDAPYRAYRPVRTDASSAASIWTAAGRSLGGGIALRDLDGDGFPDLAAAALDMGGSPLRIYAGNAGGFASDAAYGSAQNMLGASVNVAAVDGSLRRVSEALQSIAGGHVLTLATPAERLLALRIAGKAVPDARVSFVPGSAVLSLAEAQPAGATIEVEYEVIAHPSLIVSDSQPPGGAVVFVNQATTAEK